MKPQFTEGTDITARLTTWCHAPQAESAQDLMDEAAREIERLRGYRDMAEADRYVAMLAERLRCVTEPLPKKKWAEHSLPLTDKERRVLCELRDSYAAEDDQECNQIADVLDGLLERTRPDA